MSKFTEPPFKEYDNCIYCDKEFKFDFKVPACEDCIEARSWMHDRKSEHLEVITDDWRLKNKIPPSYWCRQCWGEGANVDFIDEFHPYQIHGVWIPMKMRDGYEYEMCAVCLCDSRSTCFDGMTRKEIRSKYNRIVKNWDFNGGLK